MRAVHGQELGEQLLEERQVLGFLGIHHAVTRGDRAGRVEEELAMLERNDTAPVPAPPAKASRGGRRKRA